MKMDWSKSSTALMRRDYPLKIISRAKYTKIGALYRSITTMADTRAANRPALKELFEDIKAGQIDMVVVYKIDRLSRSLFDFSRIVELFEKHNVGFVSVTQAFNTSTSSGKLMLNMLLSFAQYERELTGERIRDKFAAAKKLGLWMGGYAPLGYDITSVGDQSR